MSVSGKLRYRLLSDIFGMRREYKSGGTAHLRPDVVRHRGFFVFDFKIFIYI